MRLRRVCWPLAPPRPSRYPISRAGSRRYLGAIRIVSKDAIKAMGERLIAIVGEYRGGWSVDDLESRRIAAEIVTRKLPPAGWLTWALSDDGPFITSDILLREWS